MIRPHLFSLNYRLTSSEIRYVLLFFLISIISLVGYGIEAGDHVTYNIYYHHFYSHPDKFIGTPLELILASQIATFFTLALSPILLNPWSVLILAILFNSTFLFIAYRISQLYLPSNHALALTAIVGLVVSSPISGFVGNELIFTRLTVTTFFLLVSFLTYLRGQLFIGGLAAAAAILLHPLNAVSALVFFLPGFSLYELRYRNRAILPLVSSYLPAVIAVLFTLIAAENITEVSAGISGSEWYRYSLVMEADDVAMFWIFREGAATLIPPLGLAAIVSVVGLCQKKHSEQSAVYWIAVCQLPLVFMIVAIEYLQISGFYFGIISEVFSGIQFRRGIWVPALSALLVLYMYFMEKPDNLSKTRLIAVVVAALLDHTLTTTLLALIYLFNAVPRIEIRVGILISIAAVMWYGWNNISEITLRHELMHVGLFFVLTILFIQLRRHFKPGIALAVVLLAHSALIVSNNNFRHNVFIESYENLLAGETPQGAVAKAEKEVLLALNDLPATGSGTILFAPVALGYAAPVISRHPLFLSRWDGMLIYNKIIYKRFLDKTAILGISHHVCGTEYGSNTSCMLDKAGRRIDELTTEELDQLKVNFGIQYVVRKLPLSDRSPAFSNQVFFVYRL